MDKVYVNVNVNKDAEIERFIDLFFNEALPKKTAPKELYVSHNAYKILKICSFTVDKGDYLLCKSGVIRKLNDE